MNKDEAIRCLEISRSRYSSGNSEAAIRFAKKSISLFSTQDAVEWVSLVNVYTKLEFISKTSSTPRSSARQRRKSPSPKASQFRPFSQEQVDGITKIKRFKAKGDYYSILGVTKSAQDSEIKKAYRKVLSLL